MFISRYTRIAITIAFSCFCSELLMKFVTDNFID